MQNIEGWLEQVGFVVGRGVGYFVMHPTLWALLFVAVVFILYYRQLKRD